MNPVAKLDASISERIKEYGYTYVGVGGEGKPTYVYTIGLNTLEFPEICIIGLKPDHAQRIIGNLITRWDKQGYSDGLFTDLIGFPNGQEARCIVRAVKPDENAVTSFESWNRYYNTGVETMRVVQILWPDANGVLPTEPGYDHVNFMQVMLP